MVQDVVGKMNVCNQVQTIQNDFPVFFFFKERLKLAFAFQKKKKSYQKPNTLYLD